MYQFQGGKDKDITLADFLPGWWSLKEDEDGEEPDRSVLMAKFSRVFAGFGGSPGGS